MKAKVHSFLFTHFGSNYAKSSRLVIKWHSSLPERDLVCDSELYQQAENGIVGIRTDAGRWVANHLKNTWSTATVMQSTPYNEMSRQEHEKNWLRSRY